MDVEESWDSRAVFAKHTYTHHRQPHHLSPPSGRLDSSDAHLVIDDSDGEDDSRACFPCPYCYVEIEIPSLCIHLQEEHCFDEKNAVCPVCAANLGRDMIGHFMIQHSHLIKRRKPQKSSSWIDSSVMLGKDLQEFTSFLTPGRSRGNVPDPTPDPLLSPFLCNVSLPDATGVQETECNSSAGPVPASSDVESKGTITSGIDMEQDTEEMTQRAEFAQQLILSTIF